jgi:hypothetical protein
MAKKTDDLSSLIDAGARIVKDIVKFIGKVADLKVSKPAPGTSQPPEQKVE